MKVSSPKLIARNNALVTSLRGIPMEETLRDRKFFGRLVENAVGAALLNDGESVYYWSDRDKEVDFVVQRGSNVFAIEVTTGDGHPTPGLDTFLRRFPGAKAVRIGGERADLSLEQFFRNGIA
jgi:predicted AAA+ superfamily ATPase